MDQLVEDLVCQRAKIGIVGLGYVGLPLACLFSKKYNVVGYDISEKRLKEILNGEDTTNEVSDSELLRSDRLHVTSNEADLAECRLIVVTVPTPVDEYKKPDLHPIMSASKTIGKIIQQGTVVVFESTVFPGLTEGVCLKIIAEESQLVHGKDFFIGYSPERVNPGDKQRSIDKIVKVVSGCCDETTEFLKTIYGSVIPAGIYTTPNIVTAEAAKVIENTQRDINIAFINELSQIFERIGIDTHEVLTAARTKWNFLDFRPGLVGGHCIGVDPYYLTHLAESVGIHSQTILSGRRINDSMGSFIANKTLRLVMENNSNPNSQINVAILGVTFKENIPDLRNSKVFEIGKILNGFGVKVFYVDPIASPTEVIETNNLELSQWENLPLCDAIIVAVKHDIFATEYPPETLASKLNENNVVVDVCGVVPRRKNNDDLLIWRP